MQANNFELDRYEDLRITGKWAAGIDYCYGDTLKFFTATVYIAYNELCNAKSRIFVRDILSFSVVFSAAGKKRHKVMPVMVFRYSLWGRQVTIVVINPFSLRNGSPINNHSAVA